MAENEYMRLSRTLSRTEFTKLFRHPFIVFGDLDDDWNFEFKTKSVGPAAWGTALAAEDKLRRTTLTDLSTEQKDDTDPLGGIIAVIKSSRNPYSDRISIGRSRSCDIILPSPHVSKLHAHLFPVAETHYELRDAGSSNGTFRNGMRLKPDQRQRVWSGDKLRFGFMDVEFIDTGGLYDWLKRKSKSDF